MFKLHTRSYQRNIPLAYLFKFVAFFGITTFWVLYLKQRGMTLVQIGLLESVFHLTSLLSEIPSGMFADRFSYRMNLALSRMMLILSSVLMILGGSFWIFALGMIFSAWSYNFDSGTSTAMLFESAEGAGKRDKFLTYNSIFSAVLEVTLALGQVGAGLLIHVKGGLVWTYYIAIVLSIISLAIIYLMREPDNELKEHEERMTFQKIFQTVRKEFKESPYIMEWIFWTYLMACFAMMFNFYYQAKMDALQGWQISIVMILATLLNVGGALVGGKIGHRYNSLKLCPTFIIITAMLYFLTLSENRMVFVLVFLLPNALYALVQTVFDNDFQQRIGSAARATMSSVASMMWSIAMIILFPLVGLLIEQIGFSQSFAALGIGMLILTVIMVLRFKRMKI